MFEFKDTENPTEVLEFLIKQELINSINYFPKNEFIRYNLHDINYEEDDWRLNLKYGLIMNPLVKKRDGQIIVDIDLFNVGKIDSEKIFETTDKINKEIFNIFNWAISEEALGLLNE